MENGITINLLPKTKKILGNEKFKYILVVISLVLAGAAVFLSVNLYFLGNIYKEQLSSLSSKIQAEESSIQALQEQEFLYIKSQDKLASIDKIIKLGQPVSLNINRFIDFLPQDIEIETLSITEKDFSVTVKTSSLFSLESFFELLIDKEKGGVFLENIVLIGINEDSQGFFKANVKAVIADI